MHTHTQTLSYGVAPTLSDLPSSDAALLQAAVQAAPQAYAPYSHFFVGAAVLTASGKTITGVNQENIALPSGICAERAALFAAGSQLHANDHIVAIAIAAKNADHVAQTASPCGACRQVMIEMEQRAGKPMRVLVLREDGSVYVFHSAADLLPFSFSK